MNITKNVLYKAMLLAFIMVVSISAGSDPFFLESISFLAERSNLESPELNGSIGFYEFAPASTTLRTLDFSDKYSENQFGLSVDVAIGQNYASQFSYSSLKGDYKKNIEAQVGSNENMLIYLLSSGNYGGILTFSDFRTVSSTLNYQVEAVDAGFNLKRLIGNSYVGFNYSHVRVDYDLKLNQTNLIATIPVSHRLEETIESAIHRVGLLIGHEFVLTKDWSISVEADLGMAVANDEYSGRQSVDGVLNPEVNDNYETSNKRNYFSPRLVLASHHYVGLFKISPFIIATVREVAQVEYSGPGVGEGLFVIVNQPLSLDDVRQTSLGAGLNVTFLF